MSQTNAMPGMRRTEIRKVFRRHKGSVSRLAEQLGVTHSAVSIWLAGRSKSARIAAAAEQRALELLDAEKSVAA